MNPWPGSLAPTTANDPKCQESVWVAQLCLTFCNSKGSSPLSSSVQGILQARKLEWVAIPFYKGTFPTQGLPHCRQILYHLSHQGSLKMPKLRLQFMLWPSLGAHTHCPPFIMQSAGERKHMRAWRCRKFSQATPWCCCLSTHFVWPVGLQRL